MLDVANEPDLIALGVPGANAFSDAAGVALFYQALLHNPGELWHPEVLRVATSEIRNTFSDRPGGPPANRTIGLLVAGDDEPVLEIPQLDIKLSARNCGPAVSARAFGHPGAGGQIAWADPETGLSFAYLTNGLDRDGVAVTQRDATTSCLAALCAEA